MKRVETININGIVFYINDDAYNRLQTYLDSLNQIFKMEEGGYEVITDIEARIAELLTYPSENSNRVITLSEVEQVIETLGTPEGIAGTESEAGLPPPPLQQENPSKRLYRDPDKQILGGVCAGIANYLGINPAIIRLAFLFITLFYGVSILIYCILWIVIPKAKTTAQKLEMKGEPVTISNIEKNIRENLNDTEFRKSFQDFLDEAGHLFGHIFRKIGRCFSILIGVMFILIGMVICIVFGNLLFTPDFFLGHINGWDMEALKMLQHIISPASYDILFICGILWVGLLAFAFLFGGIKLIIRFQVKHKLPHVLLTFLWIGSFLTFVIVCASEIRNFSWQSEPITETIQIPKTDSLFLSMAPLPVPFSDTPYDFQFNSSESCFYGYPHFSIMESPDDQIKVKIKKTSQGESKIAAYRYAENMVYNIENTDSLLRFDSYFSVMPENQWKFQFLSIELYIPVGTVVIADKSLYKDPITNLSIQRYFRQNCTMIMTENKGLQ